MMCSIRRLAFVLLLAIALSIEVAESRDYSILAQDSLPEASKVTSLTAANGKLCQLCEQYSTMSLLYLKQNETQAEILSILQRTCANLAPLKQQCITLVDYYIPLFFMEVSMLSPEKLCESVHLCKKGMKVRLPTRADTCGLCHHVLVEVLTMLKDPNTQLEVIKLLLKTCSKAENYAQQCKRLVLEYVPLILVEGQKFLETTDVCSAIHACKTDTKASMGTMLLSATL
ncbi:uncharacterized protein LOC133896994 isoform X2 [Phragmites australis]|nr:uncharacterized protein LOC133896994 isoform X2 [Phragmites australis]